MLSWSVPAVTFFHLDTHHSFIYTSIARKQKADKYKKNQKYKIFTRYKTVAIKRV